jgi:uncharacterized protein YgbK (DUF1537 family)
VRLHVAADDRTGALEVAAALADRRVGGVTGVPVGVWPATAFDEFGVDELGVVDLASRHLSPVEAGERAAQLPAAGPLAHKIDSTLRGNWAHELVARAAALDRAVLVVPALPSLGRVCKDGVVLVDGRPVHEGFAGVDVRRPIESSRPADHLSAAGADSIRELHSLSDVIRWLESPAGFGVADAVAAEQVSAIVDTWDGGERVVLAGTSEVIGAAAGPRVAVLAGSMPAPVLVVCGSLSDAARAQVSTARAHGAIVSHDEQELAAVLRSGRHAILASPAPARVVAGSDAEAAAAALASAARRLSATVEELGAVVVLGGDTASAVLGPADVHVLGSLTPGTAWVDSPEFGHPVITRAGSFGDERALVDLMWGTLR